jgi:hypothetical protein
MTNGGSQAYCESFGGQATASADSIRRALGLTCHRATTASGFMDVMPGLSRIERFPDTRPDEHRS